MQIKEKLVVRLVGLVLCISLCFISFLLVKRTSDYVFWKEKYRLHSTNSGIFHEVLNRNMECVMKTDGTVISEGKYLYKIYNMKQDSLPVSSLSNSLSLFVPEKSCNVCYDEVYDALKYAQDSLSLECLIITGKGKYNEVRNIIKDLGISIKENTYYLEDSVFWNDISIVYAPFLSYIDGNLKCTHSFIPFPNHPQYSYAHLKLLWGKYFKKKE